MSSNQKLLQMQECAHALTQLGTGSPPYVPYDAAMPHACEQVLNTCPKETMNTIVLLLSLGQSLSTYKWPRHMESVSPTQGATPKRGSPYPQPKGPHQSVGVYIPNSRGHTKAWEIVSPTQGATPNCGSPSPQLEGPPTWRRER